MPRRLFERWRLASVYFAVVGFLFVSAAVSSMQPRVPIGTRLLAPKSDTLGVNDVLSSVESSTLGHVGIAALVLTGPAAEIFRGPSVLWATSVFLLFIAVALFRRLRIGAVAGVVWVVFVLILSGVVLTQISASYSIPARLFLCGPAAIVNLVLLLALWRDAFPFRSEGIR